MSGKSSNPLLFYSYKFRFGALIIFILLSALSFYSLLNLKRDNSLEAMLPTDDENILFDKNLRKEFGSDEPFIIAWRCEKDEENIFTVNQLNKIRRLSRKLKSLEGVAWLASLTETETVYREGEEIVIKPIFDDSDVVTEEQLSRASHLAKDDPFLVGAVLSRDLKTAAITLGVKETEKSDPELRVRLTKQVKELLDKEGGRENYWLAGVAPLQEQYVEYMNNDIKLFYPLILIILSLSMFYAFRSLAGVLIPLFSVFLAALCTMGAYSFLGETLNSITMMLPPLLMVIVISSSVHYLSHFRALSPRFSDKEEGIIATSTTVVAPIFFNCLTSSIGFASLAVSNIIPIRNFGIYAAFGIMGAFFITITVIPAALSSSLWKEEKRPKIAERKKGTFVFAKILSACYYLAAHHPRKVIGLSLILAIVSIIFILKIRVETNLIEYFPEDSNIRRDMSRIEDNLTGIVPLEVIVDTGRSGGATDVELLGRVDRMEKFLATRTELKQVTSLNTYFKRAKAVVRERWELPNSSEEAAQFLLLAELSGGDNMISRFVDDERRTLRIVARQKYLDTTRLRALVESINLEREKIFGSNTISVTEKKSDNSTLSSRTSGVSVLYADMVDTIVHGQLKGFGLALLAITIIMILLVKSLKFGLISIIPNLLPIMATAGAMGAIDIELNTATAMIAGVAIGIAVDDTIHFLTFFRRFIKNGDDVSTAVRRTIETSGVAMVTTSVILFLGFLALSISGFTPISNFGTLSALTMASALFGDILLLPSILLLLDDNKRNTTPQKL
ncbi:MAG: MMPL family transporter [Myxococcota bacterium]